ncbi:MAG: Ig-like domain-containing protein [Verrucomicrobia bacterium]|nr:Ig-like domain-containing protein [Verrucomicrobiota bacterium]
MASHLDDKIAAINQCKKSTGTDGDAFIFVADTHTQVNSMLSARLAQAICRRTSVDKVIFGGDAVVAFGKESDMYDCARRQVESYDTYVSPYARVYNVMGNHDIIIKDISDKKHPKAYTASDEERFSILMKRQESYTHFDNNNRLGGYFYFDNPEQKIRYIGLNGWERHSNDRTTWTAISGFSPRQAQWLIDEALVLPSEGWTLVMFMHASVAIGKRGPRDCAPFEVLRGIVNAFAQHKPYAFKGTVARYNYDLKADFTKSSGVLAAFFAGHYHQDRFIYDGNVAHVVVNCDARYNDDVVRRKVNTVTECSFDVVSLNKREKKFTLIKVGAGFNRTFHYDSRITMSPGDTRTLRSELSGELVWSSSDKAVATAENGAVKGLHKGHATITATDDKQNKEYFDVVVR